MAIGNCRYIHPAVNEQLFFMSCSLRSSKISRVTGVSERTVNRVLSLSRRTGSVARKPFPEGRPRVLNALDIAV
ncbi:hypothetical protein L208DRAFT_1408430 [Tricholoma matsutake]|nr:hypothetical protein L208DRAFT_1408430 [Tricholoma matsutake 945]